MGAPVGPTIGWWPTQPLAIAGQRDAWSPRFVSTAPGLRFGVGGAGGVPSWCSDFTPNRAGITPVGWRQM